MDDFFIEDQEYEYIGNDSTYIKGKIYTLSIQLVTYGLIVFIDDGNWFRTEIYDNEDEEFERDWRMVV